MTAILQLPLLSVTFTTATNESWRDSIAFATAGTITGTVAPGNVGTGTLAPLSVSAGAYIGDYTVTMTGVTTFRVTDPDGYTIGAGTTGTIFDTSGISFALTTGSTAFVTGDSFVLTVLPQPIDITGIRFVMQMRTATAGAQILASGDTLAGTMINGGMTGVLSIAIPEAVMATVPPSPDSSPHVLDIVAIADGDQRRCVSGTNAVVSGITFPTAA